MAYFKVCPRCGLNLDPGEICECKKEEAAPLHRETAPGQKNPATSIVMAAGKVKEGSR